MCTYYPVPEMNARVSSGSDDHHFKHTLGYLLNNSRYSLSYGFDENHTGLKPAGLLWICKC